ncbi:MAG: extracellular solute-binding protein [Christensenellales bacterium]|jgi:putative aldouronate transport system substrate-binding protein
MKKMHVSVLALLLTLVMLLSACAGGTGGEGGAAGSGGSDAAGGAADADGGDGSGPAFYSLPFAQGQTISLGVYENYLTGYQYSSGLPVWQQLEESTGMKIEWDTTPSAEYKTVMQTRLAAGVDLPDLICLTFNQMKYVNDGLIIDLTDYMDKWGYYTHYFLYEQGNDAILPYMQGPDGRIYFFADDFAGTNAADPYVWMYREEMLASTGVSELNTIDDWYQACKELYHQDSSVIGMMWVDAWKDVALAWNLHLYGAQNGWAVDDDGKVVYDYTDPRLVEVLEFLQKCYKEGLLDKEFLDLTDDIRLTRVTNGTGFSYMGFLNKVATFNKALEGAGIEDQFVVANPPVASDEYKMGVPMYGPASKQYGFTIDSVDEDFEYKFKFIDYIYGSDEGALAQSMGIEGLSWEWIDGEPVFTDYIVDNPDGLGVNAALRSLGAMPTTPWNRSLYGMSRFNPLGTISKNEIQKEAAARYQPYIYTGFPIATLMTEEQDSELARYLPDIETFVEEFCAKAITTDMDIAGEFDKFVSDLYSFGLQTCIDIRQQQYDAAGMDLNALADNY